MLPLMLLLALLAIFAISVFVVVSHSAKQTSDHKLLEEKRLEDERQERIANAPIDGMTDWQRLFDHLDRKK